MSGKALFLRTGPVRRRLSRIAAPAAWLRSLCHFAGLRIGRVNPVIRRTIMVQEIRERWLWMYRLWERSQVERRLPSTRIQKRRARLPL